MSQVPVQGEAVSKLKAQEFTVEIDTTPRVVALGVVAASPIELLKWKYTKLAGSLDNRIMEIQQYFSAEIRRTAGAGNCTVTWEQSPDGISWSLLGQLSAVSAGFSAENQEIAGVLLADTEFFFRVVLYNSNGTTSGEVRHLQFYVNFVPPQNYVLEKLI